MNHSFTFQNNVPSIWADLIKRMMERDYKKRLSANEVIGTKTVMKILFVAFHAPQNKNEVANQSTEQNLISIENDKKKLNFNLNK